MVLRKLGPSTSPGVSLPWDTVRDAVDHMGQAAADHVDREHFLVLWESLQVGYEHAARRPTCFAFSQNIQTPFPDSETSPALCLMVVCPHVQVSALEVLGVVEAKGEEADQATEQLERLLFILHTLVSHKDGAKITKPDAVCQARRFVAFKNQQISP